MNCGFIIVIFFTKGGCGIGNKPEYIIFAGECTPLTCKQLSVNAKSSLVLPFPDAGTHRLAIASGYARRRIRGVQEVFRHAALHLPRIHHDQRRPRIRNRQNPLALLHCGLLHRHGHGRAAVDTHRPLLRLRTASARTLDQRRGVEREPAAEPFRRADLGRHPLHDARSPQSQEKLDLQKDTGAGHLRRSGHHPADDPPANPDDRPAVANVRHHRRRHPPAGRRLALAGDVERTSELENHLGSGRRGLRPDPARPHRHGPALRTGEQHPSRRSSSAC